jgi:folate-binding protein YgfZ
MSKAITTFITQIPLPNPAAKMLVDLSDYGVIKVSGADAAKFLQGQLSCDVLTLQSGQSTYGAYCNIKGRISSFFRLWRLGENYYLRLLNTMLEATLVELKKYAVFSKVSIENLSQNFMGIGLINQDISSISLDAETIIMPLQQQRYEVFGSKDSLQNLKQLFYNEVMQIDQNTWSLYDIRDMVPEIYPESKDQFLPHDLNLPSLGAVSFSKGCYRGQEIIARMQHRGNLKRHMQQIAIPDIDNIPIPGSAINLNNDQSAVVVRSAIIDGTRLGLAVVPN